jgi:peptidoglycan/LPS O-acetylase OafA/YrhL
MRLIASLAVMQYHLWHNYLGVDFLHPGTDFFIILVGMVAALSEARRIPEGNWKGYLGGRCLRLYVTFVPIFLLYMISGRDTLSVEYVLKSFFFIPMPDRLPLVGVTWMLAMFWIFYLLFTLAFVFKREWVLIPILGTWGIASMVITITHFKFPVFNEGFEIIFDIRNMEFAFGYLGGWLVRNRKITTPIASKFFVSGILCLLPAIWLLNTSDALDDYRVFLYGLTMAVIATGLAGLEQQGGWKGLIKVVTHPWLVWLGGASYVLYLTHNMVLRIWDALVPITILQTPIITIVVLVVAAIGYRYWENPVLNFFRKRWMQPKKVSASTSTFGLLPQKVGKSF